MTSISNNQPPPPLDFDLSLTLAPPGKDAANYTNIAKNADGSEIGVVSSTNGTTGTETLNLIFGWSSDDVQSSSDVTELKTTVASLNISMQLESTNGGATLQAQLNVLNPSNPQIPVIEVFVNISRQALASGDLGGVQITKEKTDPSSVSSGGGGGDGSQVDGDTGETIIGISLGTQGQDQGGTDSGGGSGSDGGSSQEEVIDVVLNYGTASGTGSIAGSTAGSTVISSANIASTNAGGTSGSGGPTGTSHVVVTQFRDLKVGSTGASSTGVGSTGAGSTGSSGNFGQLAASTFLGVTVPGANNASTANKELAVSKNQSTDGITQSQDLLAVDTPNLSVTVKTVGGNPWLAGNLYVVFLINFMNVMKLMMEMTMAQNKVEIGSMGMITALAQCSATSIMNQAYQKQMTDITSCVMSAVSCGMSIAAAVGSAFMGSKLRMEENTYERLDPKPGEDPTTTNLSEAQELGADGKTVVRPAKITQSAESVAFRNKQIQSKLQIFNALSGMGQAGAQMINSAVAAATDIPIAQQQALQQILQAAQQIAQHTLSTSQDSLKSINERATSTCSALDGLNDKLNQSASSILGAR